MIQVTVRIVQRSTRNSNSQMLVNEKNSMESNAKLCTKTLAVVYFKKGLIPIVLKEGIYSATIHGRQDINIYQSFEVGLIYCRPSTKR